MLHTVSYEPDDASSYPDVQAHQQETQQQQSGAGGPMPTNPSHGAHGEIAAAEPSDSLGDTSDYTSNSDMPVPEQGQ